MAKRGRKKKKHTEEYEAPIANRIIGFILLIGSVLGLLSKVCGPLGNGIASLNLLLFGPYYVISLILILLLGLYLIINNEYPKYALIRIIGVVLLIINILVLTHIKEVGANNADLDNWLLGAGWVIAAILYLAAGAFSALPVVAQILKK